MKNLEQYVGRKVIGVEFTSGQYNYIKFNFKMSAHIGHVGEITEYYEPNNSFRINFESPTTSDWYYPAEVILPQLEKEIIGYTINDEKYAKIIAGLVGIPVNRLLRLSDEEVHFNFDSAIYDKVLEYDLLNKCTPVYKQDEITLPKLNGYEGKDMGEYI